jgi:hypothetical protein
MKYARVYLMPVALLLTAVFVFTCSHKGSEPLKNVTDLTAPVIDSLSATAAAIGQNLIVYGKRFGATQDSTSAVLVGSKPLTMVSWSDSLITVLLPDSAWSSKVCVKTGKNVTVEVDLGVVRPRNLLYLLHETRIMEMRYFGYVRTIGCTIPIEQCDTAIGQQVVLASNEMMVPYGYAYIDWDTTHFSLDFHAFTGGLIERWSHFMMSIGDVSSDGRNVIGASMNEAHSNEGGNSGSETSTYVSGQQLVLQSLDLTDTIIRYVSCNTNGRGGSSVRSWYGGQDVSWSASGSLDSLNSLFPPEVILTFRRK